MNKDLICLLLAMMTTTVLSDWVLEPPLWLGREAMSEVICLINHTTRLISLMLQPPMSKRIVNIWMPLHHLHLLPLPKILLLNRCLHHPIPTNDISRTDQNLPPSLHLLR